jgi:hypothetical protein
VYYRSSTWEVTVTSADGAQTNKDISPTTIGAKDRLVVHEIDCAVDNDTTPNVAVRIGFAASALAAAALTGVGGIILVHPDVAPGSGKSGMHDTMGAAGQKLLLTCDAPTNGNLTINYRYEIVPG